MVNYSVSLAAFEFTINGTQKCITAHASLSLYSFEREKPHRAAVLNVTRMEWERR